MGEVMGNLYLSGVKLYSDSKWRNSAWNAFVYIIARKPVFILFRPRAAVVLHGGVAWWCYVAMLHGGVAWRCCAVLLRGAARAFCPSPAIPPTAAEIARQLFR